MRMDRTNSSTSRMRSGSPFAWRTSSRRTRGRTRRVLGVFRHFVVFCVAGVRRDEAQGIRTMPPHEQLHDVEIERGGLRRLDQVLKLAVVARSAEPTPVAKQGNVGAFAP